MRNRQAFDDPKSRLTALGFDLRASTAITDPQGRVLAHAQTGGMISPTRFEVPRDATLFRFGSRRAGAQKVAAGGWWVERSSFERIVSFAESWGLPIGSAMRFLCLVPPEWSDATLLIRARATEPLLAWRGLANAVVTPAKGGGAPVRMPQPNDVAARRLHQLYIPGLAEPAARSAIAVEADYSLDEAAGKRGFLYL